MVIFLLGEGCQKMHHFMLSASVSDISVKQTLFPFIFSSVTSAFSELKTQDSLTFTVMGTTPSTMTTSAAASSSNNNSSSYDNASIWPRTKTSQKTHEPNWKNIPKNNKWLTLKKRIHYLLCHSNISKN